MICAVSAGSYRPDAQVGALDSGTLAGTLGKASLERLGLMETQSIGLGFKSLGFTVQGLGFGVEGLGFRVQGAGFSD